MIWKIIVEIIVSFVPRGDKRFEARNRLRNIFNVARVKKSAKKCGKGLRVGEKNVRLNHNTYIGDFVSMSRGQVMGIGKLTIGNNVAIGPNFMILTDNHNYESTMIPFDTSVVVKDVTIGDFCWLGANVTLLPGAHLEEGCIVQAGAVVRGHIPACSIVGGNPCKIIKERDKVRYYKLKEEQKYEK